MTRIILTPILDVDYYDGDNAKFRVKGKINGIQNAEITYFGRGVAAEYGDKITRSVH